MTSCIVVTHRLHSSSFLGLPYRIRNMDPKKELLWSLWVYSTMLNVHRYSTCGGPESSLPSKYKSQGTESKKSISP